MAVVSAIATVFGTISKMNAAKKAENRANQAAADELELSREEAAAIEAETAESTRRAKDQADKAEGTSRARAAASGVTLDGSLGIALGSMEEEHDRQINWMATAGASRARMALLGGEMRSSAQLARGDAFSAQVWGSAFAGASSLYSAGGSEGAGWWS